VSHLFGCTPLDPLGWGTAAVAAAAATGASVVLPKVLEGRSPRPS
jgi:cation-transporting ATPase I